MSKISEAFNNKKAFVAYIMAGDPNLDKTKEYVYAMQEAGADVVELGIPFSDPIAEGEVIQAASLRALNSGTTVNKVFKMAEEIKAEGKITIPLLFMTYANLLHNYGYDAFFKRCVECSISGVILPDVPFEEQDEVNEYCSKYGVEQITLIAPTSSERIKAIAGRAEGFIYLVSSMGVTGMRSQITTDIPGMVAAIKRHAKVPVAVGFGIHSPEQARKMTETADGIIVGSAIENIIEEKGENAKEALYAYVKTMKDAMN